MADGTIAVDEPTSIDKRLDTTSLTVGGQTVERERIVIAGANDVDLAPVSATLGLTVDVADRALRDCGKIDIAAFDASLPAGTNNIGDVDVLSLPALPAGTNNIGDVDVTSGVASDFEHGSNRDVDTAAEQLPNQAAKWGVTVKAARNNTANIYVGKSDVTADTTDATDGFELGPGESLFLPVNNANLIYVIAGSNNQKVFWVAA